MAANMEASMFSMFSMHVGVCMHACMCIVHGASPHTPTPTLTPIHPPTTPLRGDPRISQSSTTLELIKILFEDLKSVENSPPMGWCIVWWVGQWMGGLMGGVRSNH